MKPHSLAAFACIVWCIAGARSDAQEQHFPDPDPDLHHYAFPQNSLLPRMTSCLSLNVDGDRRPDAALLRGGELYVAFGVSSYQAVIEMGDQYGVVLDDTNETAVDLAVLPGSGPTDELLLLSNQDLYRLTYDDAEEKFSMESLGIALVDPSRVLVGHVDADGAVEAVVLEEACKLTVIEDVTTPTPYVSVSQFGNGFPVLDVVLTDYRKEPPPKPQRLEIVTATTAGIDIYRVIGTAANQIFNANFGLELASLRTIDDERIVLVYQTVGAAQQWLMVFDNGGAETTQALGPIGWTSLGAGDVDGDGKDDLVFQYEVSHDLMMMLNTHDPNDPGDLTFDLNEGFLPIANGLGSSAATGSLARPLLFDYDSDLDLDLVSVWHDSEKCVRLPGLAEGESASAPSLPTSGIYDFIQGETLPSLELVIDPPTKPPEFVPTHLEVTTFRHDPNSQPPASEATRRDLFAVTDWPVTFRVTIDETGLFFSDLSYYLTYRLVVASNDVVTRSAPSRQLHFLTSDAPAGALPITVGQGILTRIQHLEDDPPEGTGTLGSGSTPCVNCPPDDDGAPGSEGNG